MLFTIFSILYVLIAAAMIVLILMQRGDGANAGASFGGGSSGTVFGARGAASFLTRATAVLAGLFFVLTLGMGIYLGHNGVRPSPKQSLGVMAGAAAPDAGSSAANAAAVPASAPAESSVPVQGSAVPVATPTSAAANPAVPAVPAAGPATSASSAPSASN